MPPVPVAVLGCGHLGAFHARIYHALPEAELRWVMDVLPEKARALGESLGVPWTVDPEEALRGVRAVSVATPTSTHLEVSARCLRAGASVLVEKPLAASPAAGRELADLAEKTGRLLAVGHIERFNPAFVAARAIIGRPRFIESHRLSTFVPRSLDVDVVLDLMIHDLDLVLSLVPAEVESCEAVGVPVLTAGEDIANARIGFSDGTVANLTASRVSRERVRKIRFFGVQRYVSLDLMERRAEQVVLDRVSPAEAAAGPAGLPGGGIAGASGAAEAALLAYLEERRLRLTHGPVPVAEGNALEEELRDFLAALEGAPLRGADGRQGLRNLELALRIQEKVRESRRRLGLEAPPADRG
jgi:predicted dehydrogenase